MKIPFFSWKDPFRWTGRLLHPCHQSPGVKFLFLVGKTRFDGQVAFSTHATNLPELHNLFDFKTDVQFTWRNPGF